MSVFKPFKLVLISFLIWLFFYVQISVEYIYNGSALFPITVLFFYILFFYLGLKTIHIKKYINKIKPSKSKIKQLLTILFIIGFIGVLLKFYIGFFKTGIFTAQNIFEKRLENMGKELSGGAIGIVASVMYPFSFIAISIAIYNFKILNKFFLILIILVGMYPFIEGYFMGGRSTFALLGTTMVFVMYASFFKNFNIIFLKIKLYGYRLVQIPKFLFKKKILIPALLVVVLFIGYSVKVVGDRMDRFRFGNHAIRIMEMKNNKWVKFDEAFKAEFYNATKEEQGKLIGIFSLKHYFAHGVIEYIRLVNHLDKKTGYYYGEYEFNVFVKFFKAVGVPLRSFTELNEILSRKSVYSTFWGPFYIDFGLFGVIIMFFMGRFVKKVYCYAKLGFTQYVIFYGYLCTIIITSFFINFLLGSSSYFLFAFIITLLLFRIVPNNLKIV